MNANLIFKLNQKLKKINTKLQQEKKFLSSILDTQQSLVVVLNTKGEIIKFNKACQEITGYSLKEVKAKVLWELLTPKKDQEEAKERFHKLERNKSPLKYKSHWQAKDGELYFISWSTTIITNNKNEVKYIVATGIDITENKEQKDRINYMNFHDNLTDLYNRAYLEKEMKKLNTNSQLPLSIIIGDANELKLINDTYGHAIGDKMLVKIAEILTNSCRQDDIVSRWGGDEFVILLPQTEYKTAKSICHQIEQSCNQTKIKKVPLSIALGAATKENQITDINQTIKKAEEKMYKNKLLKSKERKRNILSSLLNTLKKQTDESKEHIKHVEKISLAIGVELGLSAIELNKLSLLAVVHDIVKVTISKNILTKATSLTTNERELINKHPQKGHQIVSSSHELAPIANSLLYHHENWDGSGYPLGLNKYEIPLAARIIHLAISYDAMFNGRVYKASMEKEEIIAELKENSATQFDPNLVRTLVKLIKTDNINYPANQFSRNISIINDFLN